MTLMKRRQAKGEQEIISITDEKDVIENIVKKKETGWDEVGFARPIGGFFYNYILFIVGALIVLALGTTLLPAVVPYPEIFGYSTIVTGYFKLLFMLFDAGLGDALGRFLPEYRIKNPKRAMEYISFFIWFQMFTGLVQVTMVAAFVISWLPEMTIAHLAWMMLIYSTVQYPGMLSIFANVLRSYQQFGKVQLISFLQDTLIQNITTVVLALGFGYWFDTIPSLGFVMGAATGYILGQYVDDFIALIIGAKFFSDVMKVTGFSALDAMRPRFSRKVVKESLAFGLKTMIGPVYGVAFEFIRLNVMILLLPSYATWIGLLSLAKGIAGLANIAGPTATWTGISFSESFNNGKKHLTYHYTKSALKWITFVSAFFLPELIIAIPTLLYSAVKILGTDWILAIPLIAPCTIEPLLATYDSMPMSVIAKVGKRLGEKERDGKVEYQAMKGSHILERQLFSVLETSLNFGMLVLFIWLAPLFGGINVYTFIFAPIPVRIIFVIIGWTYIDKRIISLKPTRDWMGQGLIATGIATAVFCGILYVLIFWIYPGMYDATLAGFKSVFPEGDVAEYLALIPGVLIILASLLVFPECIFAPLYAYFGGWDDVSLDDFRKAALLAGPSKGITMLMYKISKFFHERSPWKNKFAFKDTELALKEADELLQIRRALDAKIIMEKKTKYLDDLKDLEATLAAAIESRDSDDARRLLRYMVSIAEDNKDDKLATEYKGRLARLEK
ncbi:MAG: lipopolysaccharide biosynthesis protein [Candidatus Sigynarchaeum springense]